jgi:hypothetical protein
VTKSDTRRPICDLNSTSCIIKDGGKPPMFASRVPHGPMTILMQVRRGRDYECYRHIEYLPVLWNMRDTVFPPAVFAWKYKQKSNVREKGDSVGQRKFGQMHNGLTIDFRVEGLYFSASNQHSFGGKKSSAGQGQLSRLCDKVLLNLRTIIPITNARRASSSAKNRDEGPHSLNLIPGYSRKCRDFRSCKEMTLGGWEHSRWPLQFLHNIATQRHHDSHRNLSLYIKPDCNNSTNSIPSSPSPEYRYGKTPKLNKPLDDRDTDSAMPPTFPTVVIVKTENRGIPTWPGWLGWSLLVGISPFACLCRARMEGTLNC